MSDPKQNLQDDVLDLDGVGDSVGADDLQNLYDEADLANLDDLDDFDLDEETELVADGKAQSGGNEKFWLFLTLFAFALALLSASLLGPAVSEQKQRADHSIDAISKVNLSSLAASQAMTESGRFEPVSRAISDAFSRIVLTMQK